MFYIELTFDGKQMRPTSPHTYSTRVAAELLAEAYWRVVRDGNGAGQGISPSLFFKAGAMDIATA